MLSLVEKEWYISVKMQVSFSLYLDKCAGFLILLPITNIFPTLFNNPVICFTGPQLLKTVLDQWIIRPDALFRTKAIIEAPNEWSRDKTGSRRMPPAAKYDIMFSIVHPEPEKRNIKWNVKEAISGIGISYRYFIPTPFLELKMMHAKQTKFYKIIMWFKNQAYCNSIFLKIRSAIIMGKLHLVSVNLLLFFCSEYINPLLDALSPLITFHIKSQWLYSVRLEGRPRQNPDNWYSLPEDTLPHIITPLEKKLGMKT